MQRKIRYISYILIVLLSINSIYCGDFNVVSELNGTSETEVEIFENKIEEQKTVSDDDYYFFPGEDEDIDLDHNDENETVNYDVIISLSGKVNYDYGKSVITGINKKKTTKLHTNKEYMDAAAQLAAEQYLNAGASRRCVDTDISSIADGVKRSFYLYGYNSYLDAQSALNAWFRNSSSVLTNEDYNCVGAVCFQKNDFNIWCLVLGNNTTDEDVYSGSSTKTINIPIDHNILSYTLSLSGQTSIYVKEQSQITPKIIVQTFGGKESFISSNNTLNWTTDDLNVATVSNGLITGKTAGKTIITASDTINSKSITVTVKLDKKGSQIVDMTVILNSNGANESFEPFTVTRKTYYGTLPDNLTRTGYTFTGWYTGLKNGKKILPTTKVTAKKDHVLYAHWKANTITVTTDANGGNYVIKKQNYTTKQKLLKYAGKYTGLSKPKKIGYKFIGWSLSPDSSTKEQCISSKTIITNPENHTIYAIWQTK